MYFLNKLHTLATTNGKLQYPKIDANIPILETDPTKAAFIEITKVPPKIIKKSAPKTVAASESDTLDNKIVMVIHIK